MSYTIRQINGPVSDAEIEAILDSQASAFAKDHFAHVCSDADKTLLRPFIRSVIIAGLLGGEVYVVEPEKTNSGTDSDNDRVIGAAVWFPPGREMFDSEDQRKQGLEPFFAQISPDHLKWWLEYFLPAYAKLTSDAFGSSFKHENWHLQWIGVIPEESRKGIGSALIDKVREKAEKSNHKLCLETSSEENLRFYNRVGFSSRGQTVLKSHHGDWTMYALSEKE
ncbi:hypothetical protein K435DRAFT_778336 [Dendrothele bispora CBS 962.96]|uniref:N-acetyltransferase domain-containing protein n=1 Tax=Dendrothele bispora (strain CBS 962.96) TaxID=1314807 RepID=A0A4S8M3Y0_DENBC|nr:hypothetical protein K435DRAFT_778336 [Dendrothele bispora CBS 962.96]